VDNYLGLEKKSCRYKEDFGPCLRLHGPSGDLDPNPPLVHSVRSAGG
jgi:hypothetical protein